MNSRDVWRAESWASGLCNIVEFRQSSRVPACQRAPVSYADTPSQLIRPDSAGLMGSRRVRRGRSARTQISVSRYFLRLGTARSATPVGPYSLRSPSQDLGPSGDSLSRKSLGTPRQGQSVPRALSLAVSDWSLCLVSPDFIERTRRSQCHDDFASALSIRPLRSKSFG